MLVEDIIKQLDKLSPPKAACAWDNVGLMVGDKKDEVKKILVTLDVDDATIDKAIENDVDLIVSHHPLIFGKISTVTTDSLTGGRIIKMIKASIDCFSMHTNFDICGSMGDIAANTLGLTDTFTLEVTMENGDGLGKMADVSQLHMTARNWCERVKERFDLPNVKVFGDLEKIVNKIAIYPGSGRDAIELCLKEKVDVLITGDIGHHVGIDAASMGLTVIDAGHYGIEHVFISFMTDYIRNNVDGVEVMAMDIKQPFAVI